MKKTIIFSVFACLSFGLFSCENDTDPVGSAQGLQLSKDATVVTPSVLTPAADALECIKLDWQKANNGVSSVSAYQIIISDHDKPFVTEGEAKNIVEIDWVTPENPNNRTYTALNSEVNAWMNALPSFNCGVMNIDFRIRSVLGNNPNNSNNIIQYSNPITVAIQGYSKNQRVLALVESSQNPEQAFKIKSSSYLSNTDYEGHMYLQPGSYKFYKPDGCGSFANPTIYGLSSGSLVEGGSDAFTVSVAGHYYIKADLNANTYAILPYTTIGIYGEAKGTPFGVNRPMTYDATSKTWSLTFDLFNGKKFKFRALNGTAPVVIYGVSGGKIVEVTDPTSTAADIRVPGTADNTRKSYTITLDVSNPRAYTYSLVAN